MEDGYGGCFFRRTPGEIPYHEHEHRKRCSRLKEQCDLVEDHGDMPAVSEAFGKQEEVNLLFWQVRLA